MSLNIVQQPNSDYAVRGVFADRPADLAPLGGTYFASTQGGGSARAHIVGFDDNFEEPVLIRAYYDPKLDPQAEQFLRRKDLQYIGYLQFMQLTFHGLAIPPKVYQGRLADRQPYVFSTEGTEQHFIDFMGPANARSIDQSPPFYAFNGMLTRQLRFGDDFLEHPMPNGSLWSPRQGLRPNQSDVASLYGEISPGLLTAGQIEKALAARTPIETIPITSADRQAGRESYRIALNYLESQGQALFGLDESQVSARVIGDYVLLTLPDPEDFCPTLVVSPGSSETVLVHLLSDYDMEALTADAGRQALWRLRDYQLSKGRVASDTMELEQARGRRGLLTPPSQIKPGDLQLHYWTIAAAYTSAGPLAKQGDLHVLSGFSWTVLFEFSEDTGSLGFSAIAAPQTIHSYPLPDGVRAYFRAKQESAGLKIDTSNFTKAAMIRDKLAVGRKLRFFGPDGAELRRPGA